MVGRRLAHFHEIAFVTSTLPFRLRRLVFFAFSPQMPPKSRAEANAARAARVAARAGLSPAPGPPSAASEGTPTGACTPPSRPVPSAPGTAATPESVASVVSPDDLTGFPPLGAAASVSPTGGAPATKPTGGRASASAGRARKSRGGRASAAKGAKVRAARPGNLGTADSDESTVVLSPESPPAAQPPSNAARPKLDGTAPLSQTFARCEKREKGEFRL